MSVQIKDETTPDLKRIQKEFRAETKKTLNNAAKQFAKKDAPDFVAKKWNLKKASIKSRIKVTKKAKSGDLSALVDSDRTMPNVMSYKGTRQTQKGATVQYKKGDKKVIRGAFKATAKGGTYMSRRIGYHHLVTPKEFPRGKKTKAGAHFPHSFRYKTTGIRGPSVGRIVEDEEPERDKAVRDGMNKEIEQEFKRLFR